MMMVYSGGGRTDSRLVLCCVVGNAGLLRGVGLLMGFGMILECMGFSFRFL